MPVKKLREFLDSHRVKYTAISHSPAYTAQEIAAAARIPGQELAKAVMIRVDGDLALAVLPAPDRVDFERLEGALGAQKIELASEEDFQDRFPGCELGAMPPFGNLYGMETYVAQSLAADREIAFNAGSHTELIRMAFDDFERLVQPRLVKFESPRP